MSFEKQYSVKEAAAILSVHPSTVIRMIGRKELKGAWRLPGTGQTVLRDDYVVWRIPESSLQRFMKENAA